MQKSSLQASLLSYAPLAILLLLCSCSQIGNKKRLISFNDQVRPILNEKCLRCHGGVKASSGFSLLFEEEAFGDTESGLRAIVRGSHEKSELYKRIVHQDPELRMPLEAEPLTPGEVEIIKNWIDQGAKWEKHWAYIPPDPNIDVPNVGEQNWPKGPVDNFIYASLLENSLSPALEADKYTLIRRLSLDLTGLPPSIEDIQSFVKDESPQAYENLVDKLLDSPHFGERWASMWLDLARYADSKGYEKDSNREIWKYRDWVINAFNNDMPFDKFSIEQLAGDLLQEPNEDQLIATAFHRNTLANDEGGTDNEEFRVQSVLERVATTYEVWQGTTMSCVQCHSHPYDPFKQREFYESMAYFNNAADNDSYYELPKLFSYSNPNKAKVEEVLSYLQNALHEEDKFSSKSPYLYQQKEDLLEHLGHKVVQAETFDDSSPLIELDQTLNMLWQVQDSSWVKYEDVDFRNIAKIGFSVSTNIDYAGEISLRLDSLNGLEIGRLKIASTETSNEIKHGKKISEYITNIDQVTDRRDLFLHFHKGESYQGHLFYLDQISYYEEDPIKNKYNEEFVQKILELVETPTTSTPIIQELDSIKARKTFVFDRGSWLNPSTEVDKGIPDIYGLARDEEPSNRLEFAQWLVGDQNPLTSRVAVNRIWEQLFGFGLVESMEEFGSQGEKPSHPELLDWLSIRFTEQHSWRVKPLIKELVLSATYRQSSSVSKKLIESDPKNKWLARMDRTRLSAEQVRDQVLAVSGLLNRKIGGPSVKNADVQISGGWRTIPDYVIQGDSAKYRRSLYTFWKRVNPPLNLIDFDSPDRSVCSSRRIRTNTPLQALNLLNDETFFEAATSLAELMFDKEKQLEERIKYGYLKCIGREIDKERMNLLLDLYKDTYSHYLANKDLTAIDTQSKRKLNKEDLIDIAALRVLANTLLNLDEFIVKG